MKGFAKMTKVTWRFYLVALIVMLFFTTVDALYVCREDNSAYKGKLFHYRMEQDPEDAFMEKAGSHLENGKEITYIYCDKVSDFQIFGYYPMLFVLIVIMLLKQCVFMDVRTAEFQRTFPVKQWVQVLHDYLSVLGILVLSALLQLGIFLAYQTSFNSEMLKTAKAFSIAGGSEEIITHANENLLLFWGMYFLYMAAAYTWVYAGVLLAKNPVVGAILSVLVYAGACACYDIWGWDFIMRDMDMDLRNWVDDIVNYIRFPNDAFGLNWSSFMQGDEQMVRITASGLVGIMLLLIVFVLFSSKRRELSRGKLLYFPILDYPFCFLMGVLIFYIGDDAIHLVTGILAAYVIFLLIHPWTPGKRKVLEVK